MMDTTQGWLDNILEDSQARWTFWAAQELDDSFGWGAMMDIFRSGMGSREGSPKSYNKRSCGLLLTGPDGCGKHTAAAHMMQRLNRDGYEMVYLNGYCFGKDVSCAIARMEVLLGHFIDNGQSLCILLEDMEACPYRRELLTYFGQQMQNYWIAEDFPKLFLLLIDGNEMQVPSCLRSRLMLCRMSLPNKDQRSALLNQYGMGLKSVLSLNCFAEATEGVSYAQLLDMISAVYWLVDSQDLTVLTEDALRRFLAGQMPETTPQTDMHNLSVAAQKLVEQLPQILQNAGRVVQTPVVATTPATTQQTQKPEMQEGNRAGYMNAERQKVEEMAPLDLIHSVFSEEDIKVIRSV